MAQPTYTKIVAAGDHWESTKTFLTLIAAVSRKEGLRESEVFSRWLTLAACALANAALIGTGEAWDRNEARYMAEIRRFRDPDTPNRMAEALAIFTTALEACRADFLGPIFTELSASGHIGQFFTPWDVCRLMAKLTIDTTTFDAVRSGAERFVLMQEPACGGGAMVLAASETIREAGFSPTTEAHWVCVDVDWKAVCCCYIQLSLCGVSAIVIHGNALTLEQWEALPTIAARLFPKRIGRHDPGPPLSPIPLTDPEPPGTATAAAARPWPGNQMDLFA